VASIIDLLVKVQILDERQHDAVMSRSSSRSGGHIVQQIAELGYATEGTVARAISVELGLPRIDLSMTPAEPAAVTLLDARVCADRFVLPVALREDGELLWLAMADPTDQEALGVVRRRTQKRVRPAVAGPTEILRAVRLLYAAPNAGKSKPEAVDSARLAAIANEDFGQDDGQPFEVVNVADSIEGSPLSRIAKQLGVEVPAHMPSHRDAPAAEPTAMPIEARTPKVLTAIPPKTDPRLRRPKPPFTSAPPPISKNLTLEELFTPATQPGAIESDDLSDQDVVTIDAVRVSMEKSALVMRSVAELCVEKGLITREEMKRRSGKNGS